jgi:prepilin-type processing-associated H-X9-DG protein
MIQPGASLAPTSKPNQRVVRGLTRTDILVIVALVSVLSSVLVIGLRTGRAKTRLRTCLANLQQVNRAILTFAAEHNQALPAAVPGEAGSPWWWYKEQIKAYLGLKGTSSPGDLVFACPDDRGYSEPIPFHHSPRFDYSSYVYNGVTLPGMPNIAGWALSSIKQPRKTLLVMEWTAHAPLSWHRSKTGQRNQPFYCDAQSVVAFADGHVSFSKIYYDGYNAAYTQDPIPGYDYQYSGN